MKWYNMHNWDTRNRRERECNNEIFEVIIAEKLSESNDRQQKDTGCSEKTKQE